MVKVIALGDTHGQLGVFDRLAVVQARYPDAVTVFIGDYVDGLSHGFAVLQRLHAMQQAAPGRVQVLLGNHDAAMLQYFVDAAQDYWLDIGGRQTLAQAAAELGGSAGAAADRARVLVAHADLLDWLSRCPLEWAQGQLRCVHAGYDLRLADPVGATTAYDKLWVRGRYFYGAATGWGTFAHNPLATSLITGHTATGLVEGRYAGDVRPAKRGDRAHSPVYAVAYPGEQPRYLIDGGIDPHAPHRLGNVAVFDSDTGLLVDVEEDA